MFERIRVKGERDLGTSKNMARIINWNVRWHHPKRSLNGAIISNEISDRNPEVVCITEGHKDFFDDGFTISSNPDYGYKQLKDRRKVLLWSRNPWKDINTIGDESLPPGRFISGRTMTSVGEILFIGVCIPWKDAHVSAGRKAWEDHKVYLRGLRKILENGNWSSIILLGDFNQRIPLPNTGNKQPVDVYDLLIRSVPTNFNIVTKGVLEDIHDQVIDHIICTQDFVIETVKGISKYHPTLGVNKQLSDHYGVTVDISCSK